MKRLAVIIPMALGVLALAATPSLAKKSYLTAWNSIYPASSSAANVTDGTGKSCQFCHESSSGGDGWNAYGWDMRVEMQGGLSAAEAILAIELLDSDMDPGAADNLEEINGDAQPGWTDGANNTIYFGDGTTAEAQSPPAGILGGLDPVVGPQEPDINLRPSSLDFGLVDVGTPEVRTTAVENLGNLTLNVSGVALCGGTSVEYAWSPSAFAVAPGASQTVTVTYTPVDEGLDTGCLDIASDDPDEGVVQLGLSGEGVVPQPQALDYDIVSFKPSGRVSLRRGTEVSIKLNYTNAGSVTGTASATVVGVQNQTEVYNEVASINARPGAKRASVKFPPYLPVAQGNITWTVTINDDDPDVDGATAITKVVR
jgi:hypothetical protein